MLSRTLTRETPPLSSDGGETPPSDGGEPPPLRAGGGGREAPDEKSPSEHWMCNAGLYAISCTQSNDFALGVPLIVAIWGRYTKNI